MTSVSWSDCYSLNTYLTTSVKPGIWDLNGWFSVFDDSQNIPVMDLISATKSLHARNQIPTGLQSLSRLLLGCRNNWWLGSNRLHEDETKKDEEQGFHEYLGFAISQETTRPV